MEQHLCGAKKFLESVAALPNFASLQKKQFEMMGQKIQGLKSVSTDQAPSLVDVIQSMKLNEQQQVELQMLLAEKAGGFLEEKSCKARGRIFHQSAFLLASRSPGRTASIDRRFRLAARAVVPKVVQAPCLVDFGKAFRTHSCFGGGFAFHIEWSMHPPSGTDMFDMLGVWKPIVKRNLKKSRGKVRSSFSQ